MNQNLRRMLPSGAIRALRRGRQLSSYAKLAFSDFHRFASHYSRSVQYGHKRNLQAHLIFHSHAVEKGLSHSNMRYGFGAGTIAALISIMELYSARAYDKRDDAYQMGLAALKAYSSLHDTQEITDTPLSLAPEWLLSEVRDSGVSAGGVDLLVRADVDPSSAEGFRDVVYRRRSVREYGARVVADEDIREAIRVASRAPSVCNRQGIRVRIIRRPELIEEALNIQGGLRGYPSPPVLLAVTADARDYVDSVERNQPYIDGGLFAMGLLLGLEAANLAGCALNAMFSIDQDRRIRLALGLQPPELPIMLIAVGTFRDSYSVPKSFRYNPEDLTL